MKRESAGGVEKIESRPKETVGKVKFIPNERESIPDGKATTLPDANGMIAPYDKATTTPDDKATITSNVKDMVIPDNKTPFTPDRKNRVKV